MTRWWRAYDDALDDEKLSFLSDKSFRGWFKLMCLASKNNGVLPPLKNIAFRLRWNEQTTSRLLNELCAGGLLDPVEVPDAPMSYAPHNWETRQYKTDGTDPTGASRSKRYRDKKRDGDRDGHRDATVSHGVTGKRPESDNRTDTEQISEADASGADAPVDHRKRLFDEGLPKLALLTGKGPDACRSFVGKCLKAAGDDAVTVLGLIEDAERNQVVNPSAWIAARLKPVEMPNGTAQIKTGVVAVARRLAEQFESQRGDGIEGNPDAVLRISQG